MCDICRCNEVEYLKKQLSAKDAEIARLKHIEKDLDGCVRIKKDEIARLNEKLAYIKAVTDEAAKPYPERHRDYSAYLQDIRDALAGVPSPAPLLDYSEFYAQCDKCSADSPLDAKDFKADGHTWKFWKCPKCGANAACCISIKKPNWKEWHEEKPAAAPGVAVSTMDYHPPNYAEKFKTAARNTAHQHTWAHDGNHNKCECGVVHSIPSDPVCTCGHPRSKHDEENPLFPNDSTCGEEGCDCAVFTVKED